MDAGDDRVQPELLREEAEGQHDAHLQAGDDLAGHAGWIALRGRLHRVEDRIEESLDPLQVLRHKLERLDDRLDDLYEAAARNEESGDPQDSFLDEREE